VRIDSTARLRLIVQTLLLHLRETRQIDADRPPTELRLLPKEQWDGDRPDSEQDGKTSQ
jgi:hypothetical protein